MLKILDPGIIAMGQYIGALGISRKFKRYWGTTVIDGHEVFNSRMYVWPKSYLVGDTAKLLKLMGMYDSFSTMANPKGIESMWLTLNQNKIGTTFTNYFTREILADAIEAEYGFNEVKNITIEVNVPNVNMATYSTLAGLDLYNYCKTNWDTITDTSIVTTHADEMVKTTIINQYMLFDVSDEFAVNYKLATVKLTSVEKTDAFSNIYYEWLASIRINVDVTRIHTINRTSSKLLDKIFSIVDENKQREIALQSQNTSDDEGLTWTTTIPYNNDGIWYNGHLRIDAFDGFKVKDRMKYIQAALDQGYQKKSVPWWKKALVIIIVVVAVILAAPTGGYSLSWGSLATIATVAAITFSLTALYLSKNGEVNLAEWGAGRGQVLGKVALVLGIANILTNGVQQAANQAAQEGTKAQVQAVLNQIWQNMKTVWMSSWDKVASTANMLYGMYTKNKMVDIQSESAAISKAQNELEQEKALGMGLGGENMYWTTLDTGRAIDTFSMPLNQIQNKYNTELEYQPRVTNVGPEGHFKRVGVFSAGY